MSLKQCFTLGLSVSLLEDYFSKIIFSYNFFMSRASSSALCFLWFSREKPCSMPSVSGSVSGDIPLEKSSVAKSSGIQKNGTSNTQKSPQIPIQSKEGTYERKYGFSSPTNARICFLASSFVIGLPCKCGMTFSLVKSFTGVVVSISR